MPLPITNAHKSKVLLAQDRVGAEVAARRFNISVKQVYAYRRELETDSKLQQAYQDLVELDTADLDLELKLLQASTIRKAQESLETMDVSNPTALREISNLLGQLARVQENQVKVHKVRIEQVQEESDRMEKVDSEEESLDFTEHMKRIQVATDAIS